MQTVMSTPVVAVRARAGRLSARATGFAGRVRPAASNRTEVRCNARDAAWAPGSDAPAHLEGTLPGDFGFDPLGLGKDSEKLKWYVQAELQNARWAMLGVAGILVQDLFAHIGLGGPAAQVPWYEAGAQTYFAPAGSLFVAQLFMFAFVENKRLNDYKNPGSQNQDPFFSNNKLPGGYPVGYPGGIFDPLNLAKTDFKTAQLKEIKNGRLAMMAFAGLAVQANTTGATPLDNLATHLANPWATTVLSNQSDLFVWKWTDPTFLATVAPIRGLPLIQ